MLWLRKSYWGVTLSNHGYWRSPLIAPSTLRDTSSVIAPWLHYPVKRTILHPPKTRFRVKKSQNVIGTHSSTPPVRLPKP